MTLKGNIYLWHLLGNFGQILPFLANDESMKPRGGGDRGDCETVGLKEDIIVTKIP